MDLGRAFIAHAEPPELMQPGDGPLNDPARGTEPAAVRRSPLGEQGPNPALPQPHPMRFGVIRPVALDHRGARPGTAPAALHGRNPVHQGQELGDIMSVCTRQRRVERDPVGVTDDVMLAPRFTAVRRVRSRFFPPNTARTEELSTTARDQSSWFAWWSLARSTAWSRGQIPAC